MTADLELKRFKVSLSFAGEIRDYVQKVAEALSSTIGKDRVFYDEYYKSELARPNLDTYLCNIYKDESELLVVFLNKDYSQKDWCGIEWRVIRDLIKQKEDDRVMFVRFDSVNLDGLLSIDGYINANQSSSSDVAGYILERLNQLNIPEENTLNIRSSIPSRTPIRIVHGLPPAPRFVGRDEELRQIRAFWNDNTSRIIGIEAIGGSGKTALCERFLSEVISKNESDGIFVWSFYDNSNPEYFFQELLNWLKPDLVKEFKGYAWLNFIKEEFCTSGKILLVLDGLEKIQFQSNFHNQRTYGSLQDQLFKDFLKRIAAFGGQTKTIITTRFPLPDLENWKGKSYCSINLNELDIESSKLLLKSHQIKGNDKDFGNALSYFGTHALTLDHLGSVLKLYYGGQIKNYTEIKNLSSIEATAKAKKLQTIFKAYEQNLPEFERTLIGIVSLYRLGIGLAIIKQTFETLKRRKVEDIVLKQGIQDLITTHLLLFDNKNNYTVHPAVRDYFYNIFKDPLQSHNSVSQTLISLTDRPGGHKNVADPKLLDQLEELIYHLIQSKSIEQAKDIYSNRIGGVKNLGYRLGDFSRIKRLLDEFPGTIDHDGKLEYQRALGLLPKISEIEAIKAELSWFVHHRYDSILLLLGELPLAASRHVSTAKYLMGYDCKVYPTYEAAPKFQAYCLLKHFPEHLGMHISVNPEKTIRKVSKNHSNIRRIKKNNKVIDENHDYIMIEEEGSNYAFFESFGNTSMSWLFMAEKSRRKKKYNSAWDYVREAENKVVQSGSIEHLCLLHLIKARLNLDLQNKTGSEYEIYAGLELSKKSSYKILEIDFLNEQAAYYHLTRDSKSFIETVDKVLNLSCHASCRYFWGAIKAANLLIDGHDKVTKKEIRELKGRLLIFEKIFLTQKHKSKEFKRLKKTLGFI